MEHNQYDIAILGCGPAGLSAAVNAAIRNKKVIVIGSDVCSPPLHKAQKIDNYLGLPGISGEELLRRFMEHSQAMNIEIMPFRAEMISQMEAVLSILVGGEVLQSKALVIATGVPYKSTLPREEEMLGKGLGYCATCDGPIYRDKDVIIIAHSNEGEHEANFMAEICRQVYYLPLYKGVGELEGSIKLLEGKPVEIIGQVFVEGLRLGNGQEIMAEGLFVLGGETAPDRLLPGLELEENHIKVNRSQETNLPGVYAAGDCTGKPYQVAKSVGEGQIAGLNASRYVSRM